MVLIEFFFGRNYCDLDFVYMNDFFFKLNEDWFIYWSRGDKVKDWLIVCKLKKNSLCVVYGKVCEKLYVF